MRRIVQLLKKSLIRHPEKGQGLVEYALILGFAALVVIAIINVMEISIEDLFAKIAGNAPVAPPSLVNYTPPPTYTPIPTVDLNATPTHTPTATGTTEPTPTNTPTATSPPECAGYIGYGIPGRIQMENFICGGPSTAFADRTDDGGPGSGSYRTDVSAEGPDIGGSYYVGWLESGEWLQYDILVANSRLYDITFRVASNNANGRFHLEFVNNGNVVYTSESINVPNSGGDQSWTNLNVEGIAFSSGSNQLRIVIETGGFNIDYLDARESSVVASTATNTPVATATDTPIPTETPTNTPVPTNTPTPTPPPALNCTIYSTNDVPVAIEDRHWVKWGRWGWWETGETIVDIRVNTWGTITDINVLELAGSHTYFGDLEFGLQSPSGTAVQIVSRTCEFATTGFDMNLDDEAANGLYGCPTTANTTYRPTNNLSAFDGEQMRGTWYLAILDHSENDTGTLTSWKLEICTE